MSQQGLTPEQVETFNREGVLCIPEFLTKDQTKRLFERCHALLDEFSVKDHPKSIFKTKDKDHIGDQYFFESSDKVSFFFDVDAFHENGELRFPKDKAINKIGHGLHMKDEEFHSITFGDKTKSIARSLDFEDPRVLQSMCIFKQPHEKGSESRENSVPSHTDGTFLYTEPQSAVGFWFALEDCVEENGCLSYNPGSHKRFPITKRFVKINGGREGCDFIPVEHSKPVPEDNPDDYKLVPCKAGSLILIHNSVLHKSQNNRSEHSRFAYTFHVIEGMANYDNLNWLQTPPSEVGGTEFSKLYEE